MLALVTLSASGLAACSGRDADLNRFIEATRKEPGGRVESLPEVKPYDSYVYSSSAMRSPEGSGRAAGALRTSSSRCATVVSLGKRWRKASNSGIATGLLP